MQGEKNILKIFDTKKYIKEEKNKRYYNEFGLEIYLGQMGGRKNNKRSKQNFKNIRRIPTTNFYI